MTEALAQLPLRFPLRQGTLDGQCGAYALINALAFLLGQRRAFRQKILIKVESEACTADTLDWYVGNHLISLLNAGRIPLFMPRKRHGEMVPVSERHILNHAKKSIARVFGGTDDMEITTMIYRMQGFAASIGFDLRVERLSEADLPPRMTKEAKLEDLWGRITDHLKGARGTRPTADGAGRRCVLIGWEGKESHWSVITKMKSAKIFALWDSGPDPQRETLQKGFCRYGYARGRDRHKYWYLEHSYVWLVEMKEGF